MVHMAQLPDSAGADKTGSEREAAVARVVRHAAIHSRYYQDQDWAKRLRNGKNVHFSELPLTPKAVVKSDAPAFYSSYVPPSEGAVFDKFTSGSTGEPARIKKTKLHFTINAEENARLQHGWGSGQQTGLIRTMSPSKDNPPGEVRRNKKHPNSWTLYSKEPRPAIDLLCRTRCSHITLYPSQAVSILELEPPLDFLRLILTIGEIVPPELPDLLARFPDCSHYDAYGSIESGIIAGKCHQCGNYHIAHRHLIVEVLDDHDKPATPGTIGRVVVTPLYNLAMPLLRFEIGDFAVLATDTACPKSRYAFTKIVGRERNLFRLPDGSRIVPMIPAEEVRLLGVRQFKLLQKSLFEIDFIYVPSSPEVVLTEADIQPLIALNISPLINAKPVPVTEIPKSASGKYLMHESLVST